MTGGIEVRPARPDELAALRAAASLGFHAPHPEEITERSLERIDADRTRIALDGGQVVGTAGACGWDLSFPGGPLPVAAITAITVRPTHRRRGLLRALMAGLVDDARERGEPLAALTASEGATYGRFGFGVATTGTRRRIDLRGAGLPLRPAPAGEEAVPVAMVPLDPAPALLADVHDRVRADRPGMTSRTPWWWQKVLADAPEHRSGTGPLRLAVAGADGYVLWRVRGGDDDHPLAAPGAVEVHELLAATPAAGRALLAFLSGIDLVDRVALDRRPVDDDLALLPEDQRALRVREAFDHTWLRVLDVPRVLGSRTWAASVDLVLGVTGDDPEVAGAWRLAAGPDGATCARTADDPDLVLADRDLAAILLGGTRLAALRDAGLATEARPGTAAALDLALRLPRGPWSVDLY